LINEYPYVAAWQRSTGSPLVFVIVSSSLVQSFGGEMTNQNAPRVARVPVLAGEPLIGSDPYDYADVFEIRRPESDPRSAEEFARCALEEAPWPARGTVRIAHRHLLRLRLGPRSSTDHLFGWKILTSQPDVIHLEAVSPLPGRGAMVGRRRDPTRTVLTTYVFFTRPALGRVLWAVAGPLHRRIAAYLLERAAASADQTEHLAAVR
jgi:hypothetical protein